jgi:hydroxyacylglutathione hydrolase
MTIKVETIICGPLENNVYIVFDIDSLEAIVIDPSFEPEKIGGVILANQLNVQKILITHAHFDHFYGVPYLLQNFPDIKSVYLHMNDLNLWQEGGAGRKYLPDNLDIEAPFHFVKHGGTIEVNNSTFQVRLAPGHSSGSVIYYCEAIQSAFVGDVIFYHSIGRTDLQDGDQDELISSIHSQILTLPGSTHLYPGHGPATSVAEESRNNPFL